MNVKCRLCKKDDLTLFLDLGFTPPSDQFLKKESLNGSISYFPLRVVKCNHCEFIQLDHVVDPEILYQNDYPYMSSTTAAGRKHFDNFADKVVKKLSLNNDDLAIDIGSNVGVLLSGFKKRGVKVLGIDPAPNIAKIAEENGIRTLVEFFGTGVGQKVRDRFGRAKVITGSNVFAHIDDLHGVMSDVNELLHPEGVFIIEAPYLEHLIDNLEYDTIYHEHLSYISLSPLVPFLKEWGYEIFDLDEVKIHGGSLCIYVAKEGTREVSSRVLELLKREKDKKIHDLETLNQFAKRVKENREKLTLLIKKLKGEGKRLAGVSAPAKGMTLLNYCGISKDDLLFVTEKCELKVGRYTPGGNIPVKTDTALIDYEIDYALLLAWNFSEEIMNNLKSYRERGGKFIIPIPEPKIV